MAELDSNICDRFEGIYPGAIVDCLDQRGYPRQTIPHTINPITLDMRVAGVAYPVSGRPDEDADYDENIRRFLTMLGEVPPHSVITYETRDDYAAQIGELSTTALQSRGCRGAVLDGGVRDVNYILEQNFPVFARYRTPADAPPRWRLEDWNVPIRLGDVKIAPGDMLVGDVDGVVCVPQDIAIEVLEEAEETVNTENKVRASVRDGVRPLEAYDTYGKF